MLKQAAFLCSTLAMVGIWSAPASAQSFKPFTQVTNVCPTCEPDRFDQVTLKNGGTVEAWIVRDNSSFLVLERHGELRVMPKSEVVETKLTAKRDADERRRIEQLHMDQIILSNGHVLSGRVTSQGDVYNVSSPNGFTYTAERQVISKVVLKGVEKKP